MPNADKLLAWDNGTYRFIRTPLDKCKITQPFGVDYVTGTTYSSLGLKGHNGLDLSAPNGTNVYAVDDGFVDVKGSVTDTGYGLNIRLYIYLTDDIRIECVYAHLKEVLKTGDVKAGDIIAHSDNTGMSTGPHLHFGVRPEVNGKYGWDGQFPKNGYVGFLNPEKFFDPDAFKLPVELRYGQKDTFARRLAFAPSFLWYLKTFKKAPSFIAYNALAYGFWDARFVNDPAMFPIYSQYTKVEAMKLGLIK